MRFILPVWVLLISALSLIPLPLKYRLGTTGEYHNWGHFCLFLITAVLFGWDGIGIGAKLFRSMGAICLGFLLEYLEVAVYRQSAFEWHDVMVDTFGVLCGFVILTTIPLLRRSQPQ